MVWVDHDVFKVGLSSGQNDRDLSAVRTIRKYLEHEGAAPGGFIEWRAELPALEGAAWGDCQRFEMVVAAAVKRRLGASAAGAVGLQAIVTAAESARASRTGVPRWQPAEMRNASRHRDPTYTSSMATNARTVRLTPASYDLLEQEARRRGTDPDALADELLRSDLGGGASEDLDAALARSDELRSRLPEIDGVALAREARRELDNRDA